MGKHKLDKEKQVETEQEAPEPSKETSEDSKTYEELIALISVIAKPLASRKLTKRLYKTVKKAQKVKRLRRGVREVVKGLRKNEKGIVVLAGDVSPVDVISHIPVFCEDKNVPYCYVPSRKDLGVAGGTKRPTSVVLIQSHEQYKELYDECYGTVDALPMPIH